LAGEARGSKLGEPGAMPYNEGIEMASAKLHVSGMTCGHCQAKVQQALSTVSGVYSAVVDLEVGEAEVDFDDDSVTMQQLLAAVEQAGYGAKLVG
jgi:copper chaperone